MDADLSGYFDSIPHAELMKSVARRVSDRHLPHLIKMWLEAPVEEIDESFEFLGYTIGRCDSPQTGRSYLGTKPSKNAISRLCGEISELTGRRWGFIDTEEQVARINRKLEGWSNYFRIGPVSKAYRAVDQHTATRLRQWLCRKHKVQGAGTTRYPYRYLYEKLKLVRLEVRRRNFAWAKA